MFFGALNSKWSGYFKHKNYLRFVCAVGNNKCCSCRVTDLSNKCLAGCSLSEQDISVWPFRSGRFGLSRFGLGRFGLGTFRSRHFCT